MNPIIITALATNGSHIVTDMTICRRIIQNANGISRNNKHADGRMNVARSTETDCDDARMITIAIANILLSRKAKRESVTAANSFRDSGTEPPTRSTKEAKRNLSTDTKVMSDAFADRMMRVNTMTSCDDVNALCSTSVYLHREAMRAHAASILNSSFVTKASVADMSSSKGCETEPGARRTEQPRGITSGKTVNIKTISRHVIAGTIVNVSMIACPLAMKAPVRCSDVARIASRASHYVR